MITAVLVKGVLILHVIVLSALDVGSLQMLCSNSLERLSSLPRPLSPEKSHIVPVSRLRDRAGSTSESSQSLLELRTTKRPHSPIFLLSESEKRPMSISPRQ